MTAIDPYRVDVPAPRSEHSSCACSSCACCAEVRADLVDAARDVADAHALGDDYWVEMTRQQPLHPSMKRLLDSGATLEHRHHGGSSHAGELAAREAGPVAGGVEGLFPPPAPARVD